jgi:hypothetical protein
MFKSAAVLALASAFAAGCASTESDQTTSSAASTQSATQTSQASYRASRPQMVESGSSLITLYAHDPVAKSFSVDDGEYGGVMRPNGVFNRDSDVTFGAYRSGYLSFAMQGRDEAHVINLGSSRELAERYGYGETVGGGQGYASIAFRDGEITIFEERHESYQPLREAETLINSFNPDENEIRPEVGHIYLARLVDGDEATFVKLYVVAMDPQSWIVLRWERLDPDGVRVTMRGR